MSSALPLASVATVDVASGATVAANDDDADGAVVPLSSTEDEHQKQHHVPYSLAILLNGTF